jgi:predicted DsbA family dithiol-disulfide isomerase
MDINKITTCFTGSEGKQLLSDDIKIASSLKISASPTFLANNRVTFNALSASDIQSNICKENVGMAGCGATLNSTTVVPAGSCTPAT